jgi:glycosyltransferase AglI
MKSQVLPFVSIVVPVASDVEGLGVTLQSLGAVRSTVQFEVLVCDDGGPPSVQAMALRFGCRWLRLPENRGSYAARNAGVIAARSELIAFLDADQSVDTAWLDEGLKTLENHDYVGGCVVMADRECEDFWSRYDVVTAFDVRRYLEQMKFAPTANLFVRKSVFEKVGLFDERLRSGGDREFGLRVFKAGIGQTYCENARTFHPVRGKSALLRKRKRTGSGMAEVRLLVWRQSPLLVIGHAMLRLVAIPFEWCKALTQGRFGDGIRDRIGMGNVHARLSWTFHVAYLLRSLQLLARGR